MNTGSTLLEPPPAAAADCTPPTLGAGAHAGVGAHRLALITLAATIVLLAAGGLVTSTNSGDAVPDWWFAPLSYGTLFPAGAAQVWIEHGHRIAASAVGLLTLCLAAWLGRNEPRRWVRNLGVWALAGVVAQGILGGIRVLLILPPQAVAIVHACLAQAFFCLIVAIALFTSRAWRAGDATAGTPTDAAGLRRFAQGTTVLLFLQLVAGAVMRHTGAGLLVHIGGALAVMIAVSILAGRVIREHAADSRLLGLGQALGFVLMIQLGLGVGSFAFVTGGGRHALEEPLLSLVTITAHLVVGALLLAGTLALTLWTWRPRLLAAESALSPLAPATAGGVR
ncbi:MAG: COX15/CtaA family protein [Planctomycetes bacterium]|nr:COX15/CtaA family protein [Planctomycetota bacterium]